MRPLLIASLGSLIPLSAPALAQVHHEWLATYDASATGSERANDVVFVPSGGVYVVGRTAHFDALALKYDAAGNLAWARTYTLGSYYDVGYVALVDPTDESLYMIGRTDTNTTCGLIVKYDTVGNVLWSAIDSTSGGTQQFSSARLASNHDLVVGGARGSGGIFVARFDAQGNRLWETEIPGGDYASDLAFDSSGDILVVGPFDEVASTTKFGVAKISASGALLWRTTTTGGGTGLESAAAVTTDATGAVYAVGRLIDPVSGANGALVKMDSAGNVLWTRENHGSSAATPYTFEKLEGVVLAASGNVRVAGLTGNIGAERDIVALEYTPLGQVVWRASWNGPGSENEAFEGLSIEPDGSLTVLAQTEQPGELYDPVVLRWNADGSLRYADIDPVSATQPGYVYTGKSGPDGVHAFAGVTTTGSTSTENVLVIVARDQSVPFCFGDGSSSACPCGNSGSEGRGCANSVGLGAALRDSGEASLASDTLILTSSGEPATSLSIFVQGSAQNAPVLFGDGLLCSGGNLKRLYLQPAAAGSVSVPAPGDAGVSARSASLGDPLAAGSTRYYQAYYRDASASFCPAPQGSTFNTSSALAIHWTQ